jgi:hypothetical protein
MTPIHDSPNFSSWQHDTLVQFATDVYARLVAEQEANEQLRLDLKDAMKLARQINLRENAA